MGFVWFLCPLAEAQTEGFLSDWFVVLLSLDLGRLQRSGSARLCCCVTAVVMPHIIGLFFLFSTFPVVDFCSDVLFC